jgi:hypothetical protein
MARLDAQAARTVMVHFGRLTVEVGIPLLKNLKEFLHFSEIHPGKPLVIPADVPAVVDQVGKLDGFCLRNGPCQMLPVYLFPG